MQGAWGASGVHPPSEFGGPTYQGPPGGLGGAPLALLGCFLALLRRGLVLIRAFGVLQRPAEANKSPPGVDFGALLASKMMIFDNYPSPSFFILFDALFV